MPSARPRRLVGTLDALAGRQQAATMALSTHDVRGLIGREEGQHLEFVHPSSYVQTPITYARSIASFANSEGGVTVVRLDDATRNLRSNDDAGVTLRDDIDRALAWIYPPVPAVVGRHRVDDEVLFTVEVEPSTELHVAAGMVPVRAGAGRRAMDPEEVRRRISHSSDPKVQTSAVLDRLFEQSAHLPREMMNLLAEHDRVRDERQQADREKRDRAALNLNIRIALISGLLSLAAGAAVSALIA